MQNANSLSIRLWSDGFSFTTSAGENTVGVDRRLHYVPLLKEHLATCPTECLQQVEVVVHDALQTLIPLAVYRPQDVATWLSPLAASPLQVKQRQLMATSLTQWQAKLLWSVEPDLYNCLNQQLTTVSWMHSLGELSRLVQQDNMTLARMRAGLLDLLVVRDGKLLLGNSMPVGCVEDAAYHVLNAYQQLEIDMDAVPLTVVDTPALESLLNQYKL